MLGKTSTHLDVHDRLAADRESALATLRDVRQKAAERMADVRDEMAVLDQALEKLGKLVGP